MKADLRVERVLYAAPEAVFDAFTDPDAQQEMYADAPDWVVRSECDLRVGKEFIDGWGGILAGLARAVAAGTA
jgi:uncharacterized protein YndB with AHSA1/START domain